MIAMIENLMLHKIRTGSLLYYVYYFFCTCGDECSCFRSAKENKDIVAELMAR